MSITIEEGTSRRLRRYALRERRSVSTVVEMAVERLLEEISFSAPDRSGEVFAVTAELVRDRLQPLVAAAFS